MIVRRLARRVAGASVAPFVAGVGVVATGPPLIEATAHSLPGWLQLWFWHCVLFNPTGVCQAILCARWPVFC